MSIPTDISNLALWLDAQDAATFTFSSGSDISQWADKSGSNNHAVQATGSLQPLYVASAINSRPSVEFGDDATAKLLSVPDHTSLDYTTFSLFVVFQRVTDVGTESICGKWSEASPSGQREHRLAITSGDAIVAQGSLTGATSATATSSTLTTGIPVIADAYYDGTNVGVAVDNASAATAALTSIFNGTSPYHIGSRDGGSQRFAGYIGELIFFTSVLSAGDRTAMLDFLRAKWMGNPYHMHRQL